MFHVAAPHGSGTHVKKSRDNGITIVEKPYYTNHIRGPT